MHEPSGRTLSATNGPGIPALEKEVASRLPAWIAAGLILALVRRMATHHSGLPGGASVNKAVFILEQVKFPLCPKNSNDLWRAWTMFRSVSHFCAALFDVFEREGLTGFPSAQAGTIRSFLADAEAYQIFGRGYVPLRAKGKAVLGSADTWLVPSTSQWEPTPSVCAPLDHETLAIAKSYRAPSPSS